METLGRSEPLVRQVNFLVEHMMMDATSHIETSECHSSIMKWQKFHLPCIPGFIKQYNTILMPGMFESFFWISGVDHQWSLYLFPFSLPTTR